VEACYKQYQLISQSIFGVGDQLNQVSIPHFDLFLSLFFFTRLNDHVCVFLSIDFCGDSAERLFLSVQTRIVILSRDI